MASFRATLEFGSIWSAGMRGLPACFLAGSRQVPGGLRFVKAIFVFLGCLHLAVGPLNLLQVVAWTGMLFDYSKDRTLVEAAEMTFSGDHPCPMCLAIEKAKEKDKRDNREAPAPRDGEERQQLRHDLKPLETDFLIAAPKRESPGAGTPSGRLLAAKLLSGEVPSPPPRRVALA